MKQTKQGLLKQYHDKLQVIEKERDKDESRFAEKRYVKEVLELNDWLLEEYKNHKISLPRRNQ